MTAGFSLGSWLLAAPARADSDGSGVGFGPLLAFSADDSIYLGWELAGSADFVRRGAVGGAYPIVRHDDDPTRFHYLVWEPWLYAGGTLGLAVTEREPRVVYGLWEALGQSLTGNGSLGGGLFENDELQWVFSIAIGWRGMGGTQQFYLTPKLWRMHGWRFNS